MSKEKSTHGGPGRGGGRNPIGESCTQPVTVTLDPETIAMAKEIGRAKTGKLNLSAGIRAAVAEYELKDRAQ